MDLQSIQKNYAQLILQCGLNLQKNQKIRIKAESIHAPFVSVICQEAYKMGAAFVSVDLSHDLIAKARIDHSAAEHLTSLPNWEHSMVEEICQDDWCILRIEGSEDPDALNNLDQSKNATVQKTARAVMEPLHKMISAHSLSWCIAGAPTPGWAAKIFNEAPSQKAAEKLWELLIPILRLDQKDPVQAWKQHAKKLNQRAQFLSDQKIEQLHFQAPGTDLKVKLVPGSHWAGGHSANENNIDFIANIPTEEVFTTPHYAFTEGRAQVTRPVHILGGLIEGAWFEFEKGKVVQYGAQAGKEYLDTFFNIDDRAYFLGEVALVDSSSPIFSSGKLFHSILFDENAACHIALGSAYPLGFERENLSKKELMEKGMNQSILHSDFMIGCPDISVTGTTESGQSLEIIKEGLFSL